jgi:hypothetical protein
MMMIVLCALDLREHSFIDLSAGKTIDNHDVIGAGVFFFANPVVLRV